VCHIVLQHPARQQYFFSDAGLGDCDTELRSGKRISGANERKWILEAAKSAAVICTRDRVRAAMFYRDTLGLRMKFEDNYAVVFNFGGIDLRVSTVPDFTVHEQNTR
jgi:hypothetical protein